ncbi:MAG: tellurium resistance protein [Desulfobacteraceae bacterium]|nr:MAG: tellurium resistance protein [Desulfobacteraceae bacterium]
MSEPIPVPEGEVAKRPLQFFWITDYSGSMSGKRIATLNQAIRESIPAIRKALASHPEVEIKMRAIKFSDRASWHVGPDSVSLDQFSWTELDAKGVTATAQAINLLASELSIEKIPRKGYPPVCLLISDGFCTDSEEEYDKAIQTLANLPWGKKSVRLAIGIGKAGEDYDEESLLKFVSHREIGVLQADTPEKLVQYIKWASVTASVGSSQSKSKGGQGILDGDVNVNLPEPPADVVNISSSIDVF